MASAPLNRENAIRIEKYYPPGKNGGAKNNYIFKCINSYCENTFKIKGIKRLATATGLCMTCNNRSFQPDAVSARKLRPYESTFNRLIDSAKIRDIKVEITYEDYLKYIELKNCHYCLNIVKITSHAYCLDRKDNNIGYIKDNLVLCCARCNKGKRELYTYEMWYGMTEYFRKLNEINKTKTS